MRLRYKEESSVTVHHLPEEWTRERNALIRAHRKRIAREMERIGKGLSHRQRVRLGLVLGDSLKSCIYCENESVEDVKMLWRWGWREAKNGDREDWICPDCKHRNGNGNGKGHK